ncbi:hypothetical protein SDRG_10690 [Saprolegnia diclina VS20]|uniref:Glycosyltransferase subfamily 4-like N-terminal domain-containing protein n=1 Tax=Saprolegnia diclina (strain VS20) TaxID=1156394 RepID=T0QA49_SAPDV|nr:hypothetical protein SDRG_10690 [Saprolegnia diclina VS20]EQC31516.1 hypothetical protein SDRG_10690 [Saprolegnia diclina VS20]|eukprot:XP_008614915.1 hypothetical protein SDRG_10690 [Saprolegnia diclina VS20]
MAPQRLETASWSLQPSFTPQKRPVLLLVNDSLPTAVNGIMTVMRSLEAAAIGAGYDVVHLDPTQFPHRSCPLYPEFKLSWPATIGAKIRAAKPSYIHIVTEGPLGVAAALYCMWNNLAFNSAYHTRLPEYTAALSGLPESLCNYVVQAYVRWCHRASHCVLTTTPAMAHALASYGLQVPIATMPFGVDRRLFRPTIRRARETTTAHGPILLSFAMTSTVVAERISARLSINEAQAPSTTSPLALGGAGRNPSPCHCSDAEGQRCDACKDVKREPRIPASAHVAIGSHDRPEPDLQHNFVPASYFTLSPRERPSFEGLEFVPASLVEPRPYDHHAASYCACCALDEHQILLPASACGPEPYPSAHAASFDWSTFVPVVPYSPRGVSSAL